MENMIPTWLNGQLQPMDKLQAHLEGHQHKAVSVFLLKDAGILIQRRALEKYHTPGLWANTCCTHPLWDEKPLNCAHRRLEQELGIVGQELRHQGIVSYRADVGGGMIEDEVVDVFVGTASDDLKVDPNPGEVMDWRWVDLQTLDAEISQDPDRFTPWMRIYLKEHRAQILDGFSA